MTGQRIVLVANPDISHVGHHLRQAAEELGLTFKFCDLTEAFNAPYLVGKFNWWLGGHHPYRLREFSEKVIKICKEFWPDALLCTGLAPIEASALAAIDKLGIKRLNYLTDDPFNKAHRAPWFIKGLPLYDCVFSTRKANIEDLKKLSCQKPTYLPFAYNPHVHYPEPPVTPDECSRFESDIVFAGGADSDRIPYASALIKAGFKVGFYGGYWERFKETRAYSRGHANHQTLRKAISSAKIALCLVRRANRDGHSMRSFEIPAIGACMLTEDTDEHREIFGEEGKAVSYFKDTDEIVKKAKFLLENNSERERLANAAHTLILNGNNTYKDRLVAMLKSI